jgi:hypothetical protein
MPTPTHKTLLREYRARVRKAANLLKAGMTDSRELDNCFEMHDGDLVVTALVRQAQADSELAAAMYPKFVYWQATAQEYALIPDAELAYEARRHVWKAWLDWEISTAANHPEHCYVYEVVFDYGGSVTFASDMDMIDTAIRLQGLGVKFNNIVYRQQRLNEATESVVFTTARVAAFLRALLVNSGGQVIGHELQSDQIEVNNTFNHDVDERIRKVKNLLHKHTGHYLHQMAADIASTLADL